MSHPFNPSLRIHTPHNAESFGDTETIPAIPMGPPTKPRKRKAPTLRAEAWEPYKARILELHITQKLPLREIKEKIEEEFDFTAEIRQYRTRISQWGKDKNIKPAEMTAIVRKRQQRKLVEVDKGELIFTVRGSTVESQKIDRWMNRHRVPENLLYAPSPAASTPTAVRCRTISERGSPVPSPAYSAQTPNISPAGIMSAAQSPAVFSPALSVSSIVQPQNSTFAGQSPAPIYRPLPRIPAGFTPTPSAFQYQLDTAAGSLQYRYKQTDEERLREELSLAETLFGTSHSMTLDILPKLGNVLMDQERWKEAFGVMSPIANQPSFPKSQNSMPQSSSFVSQQNVMPINLPPSQFSNGQNPKSRETGQSYGAATTAEYSEPGTTQAGELMMLDQMSIPGTVPVFGGDGDLNTSPYVGMPEDFMAYLFNLPGPSNMTPVIPPGYANYGDLQNSRFNMSLLSGDDGALEYFPKAPQTAMAVNNLLEQQVPEATISEEKSQELFDFIKERFHDNTQAPVNRQWDGILEGDRTNGDHMLSKRMMQAYIGSYWYHFSDQMPILHKPTFSPDKTPNLLLLSIMAIGGACLDRTHGHKVTKAGAQLSNFLAWHLRWDMFMDINFRPPAKLWGFQALILLELYEKMYSSSELHERAHIHHATTITLMRRGRSLIGKSALESPPNPRDSPNGSRRSSTSSLAPTAEKWWEHWVTNEATRRAAFAVFVIDSIHATMFGHSAVTVAHEMRLPLPCDDAMWWAGSSAEVWRIESNLMSNGIKPMSFLEGLKRTLSNQDVRTNSFGRTVLMAGLLSVSWHMHQRDLQVNVLGGGIIQALGGRDRWRATLTRAYDTWKADFDKSLKQYEPSADPYRDNIMKKTEFNVVFESRTVLYHLAHMAMHADIVDCQTFARAKRLLGRAIGPQEFGSAQRRIKDHWAHSARAREATFYALKFLCSVLAPDQVTPAHAGGYHLNEPYDARDDVLLNRPWVLYVAALVVWCYGFALEGPCPSAPIPTTRQEKLQYMREYFVRFGTIENPRNLQGKTGINANTALLMILKDTFETTRWELLHEASTLLNNCIVLNSGGTIH